MTTSLALRLVPTFTLAFSVACAAGGSADSDPDVTADTCATESDCTVTITHGPVTPVGVVAGAADGVGTERFFHGDVDFVGFGPGVFDGTMITTSVDTAAGAETRITTIVFVLDDTRDQLILEGASIYPTAGSTIEVSRILSRPIIGGSGVWADARGTAETTHLEDDSWKHVFSLVP